MDLNNFSSQLTRLKGDFLYIHCSTMDFSSDEFPVLHIFDAEIEIKIPLDPKYLTRTIPILRHKVFTKQSMNICWDIKNLYSYVLYHTEKELLLGDYDKSDAYKHPKLLDLHVIESYSGISLPPPTSRNQALARTKKVWPLKWVEIYNKIHIPLMRDVIPHLETIGIIKDEERVYSHYEIEGQENGRLKCSQLFKKSYNPHIISDKDKPRYKAPFTDWGYLIFDFNALEVRVLQWLSGDENLARMLESGDVYLNIFEEITGLTEKHEKCRKFAKDLMLPVIFGAGPKGISENLKIKEEMATKLINKLHAKFPVAFSFLRNQQDSVTNETAKDYFNRGRRIAAGEQYKARNFSVQSPSATICMAKLIDLFNFLKNENFAKLGFFIHDAFGIFSDSLNYEKLAITVKEVLEADCEICPGLELKVVCKSGAMLNEMKILE